MIKNIIDKIEKILIPVIYLVLAAIAILIVIALCRGKLDGVIAALSMGTFLLGVIKDKWPNEFRSGLLLIVISILLIALGMIFYIGNNMDDTVARAISVVCLAISVIYIILTAVKSK